MGPASCPEAMDARAHSKMGRIGDFMDLWRRGAIDETYTLSMERNTSHRADVFPVLRQKAGPLQRGCRSEAEQPISSSRNAVRIPLHGSERGGRPVDRHSGIHR